MPGSPILIGILPLTNSRHIFAQKPKTITYDGEVYLGLSEDGSPCSAQAVVHYFVAQANMDPLDNRLYFVVGKAASVHENTCVGEGNSTEDYDIEIDAMMLQEMPSNTAPMRPVVIIAGVFGQKSSNHAFHLDINQYVAGDTRLASYICSYPPDNKRFQSLGILKLGSTIVVTGFIVSEPVSDHGGAIKWLPLEVKELAFLMSDSAPSPAKGKSTKWNWGNKSPSKSTTNDHTTSSPSKSVTEDTQFSLSKHAHEDTHSDGAEDDPRPAKRAATAKPGKATRSKGKQKAATNTPARENDGVKVKHEFIEGCSGSPLSEVD
ncbi:hypothetical protein DFJ58DRAFT_730269 [Suillus subalutaceus]|uniref:uncharacterized protein n=1 Tax=Suillus subalutaceus TaxID=48586 RepID=UPI001B868BB9|nr:uncharacterized protein DFJ58DRAFT_730269 [Suillus subalutaceus]KAG1847172.1 hypothetical protein DFJ58DRAFT_730269 [Suillus subalutaceus]